MIETIEKRQTATTEPEANVAPPENVPVHAEKQGTSGVLWLILAALVLGVVIFRGIHSRSTAEKALTAETQAAAVPSVTVTHPVAGSAAGEIVLPGDAQAYIDTPIYARTNGYLRHWYADIGAHVRQGQLLAEIETPELDQQLQQAQADLKTAQANLALADTTNARWQKLLAKHAVSVQEGDQTKSDFIARQAAVSASEANVRRLEQMQSFEKVTAPYDGVITARNTDIGALIDAGSSGTPKQLFHLASVRTLRVFVPVPEVYAAGAVNGAKVQLTQDANPNQVYTGIIVRNSNSIDQTTRTLNVEVDVDNSDGKLMPGAYLFVHLKAAGAPHAVTIPSNTLLFRSEGLHVGVVRDGHVHLVPITIGQDFGSSVEVTSGLTASDEVILDPSDSLTDGAQVEVSRVAQTGTGL